MKIQSIFKKITIKKANIFSVIIIFFFTMFFVGLLVEEMYEDYEATFEQNIIIQKTDFNAQELLAKKQKTLKAFFIKIVLAILTLSFILFALFLGLNNIFNTLLQQDTKIFLDFFDKAAEKNETIKQKKVFFEDFKIMVGHVNEMIGKINEQRDALLEMNQSLEYRVKNKTQKLEEEKQFSQELLKSQKEFLKYAVHETNTPLSVILTSIELYLMKHPKDRQLSKIEVAVKNIFSIYDDLSYLVKRDQVEYPKVVLNLHNYIQGRLDFFTEVAELSKLRFQYIPTCNDVHIYFNETKLQRIVDNTITNAIKYTLANEIVYINLDKTSLHVKLFVGSKSKLIKDTNKVFEHFYREEKGRDGFGLGLGLVKTICNEEDVKVEVSSNEEQTSFTYKFKIMGA